MKRWLVATVLLLMALAAGGYALLAGSLPRRSGTAVVPGLTTALEVTFDARANPTVSAERFADALRGQGYLHAQERFFQMDLLRRSAAGELAALFGERALPADRAQRAFDYREQAVALRSALPAEQLEWLAAYTEGVNAGLEDLGARPPEYWLVGVKPEPWQIEDSLLVVLAFCTMLSNNDSYERPQGVLHEVLPPQLYEFLTPSTSRFDRPVIGASVADPTGGYLPLPIPGPDVVDLRQQPAPPRGNLLRVDPPLAGPASNQWAVGAERGAGGRAILANDPHLALRLPNVFYRVELEWGEAAARGVSIPGLPGVLIGASDHVAWGATVSNADQSDWVVIEVDPSDASRYRTPEGFEPFEHRVAEITVAGRTPERVETRHTRWGPVVGTDWRGRPLALHATWREQGGVDLAILALPAAKNAASAAALLASWAGPSLNWMLADRDGGLAWVVNGPLPRRTGFDGSKPESLADGGRRWDGWLEPPLLLGGRADALFTANSRTLPSATADTVSRMWMRPLRAKRIADLLAARRAFTEGDFLAMQLDTRAEGYDALRSAVLAAVASDDPEPLLRRARAHVEQWNGHADADQAGFRILHSYYRVLLERAIAPLLAPATAADAGFVYRWPLADESLRRLLDEQPAHLLTREHASWPEFLRTVLLETLQAIEHDPGGHTLDATWGSVNALDVQHPFASQVGPLGRLLSLPAAPLPGSMVSLRVAAPSYGAVLRMAVSPSALDDGVLELAAGQSGHFLSPNFRDTHADWLDGAPTPFLAGEPVARIALRPPGGP
jgi:penicillin amidase